MTDDENTALTRPSQAAYGQAGTAIQRSGFGAQEIEARRETQGTALAAKAKAEIEARYIMAMRCPRNVDEFRVRLLGHCRRPKFAEVAEYRKPVGGSTIKGASIRFVESALREYRNVLPEVSVTYEDEDKRIVSIRVTDLEANVTYTDEALVEKFVERKRPKSGDEVIGQRLNSYNETVYKIRANEDDYQNKLNAAVSKKLRNLGLRILPADIVEEAMAVACATRDNEVKADPDLARRRVIDAFAAISVMPPALSEYLGHDLGQASAPELDDLRAIHLAIRDGETTWAAVMTAKKLERGEVEESKPVNEAAAKVRSAIDGSKSKIAAARSKPSNGHAPTPPTDGAK